MRKSLLLAALILNAASLWAKGAGVSAGTTVLSAPSARAAGLGEAFTAMQNDITAFPYNPATLQSLKTGHAAFLYQKGLEDDAYGQVAVGKAGRNGGLGLLVGYYNGGRFNLIEGGTSRQVTAKSDLLVSIGHGFSRGRFSLGLAGKYLSSTLAEKASATAFMADVGGGYRLTDRLFFGTSIQNLGTNLQYGSEAESLPRVFRNGLMAKFNAGKIPFMMSLDAPYHLNESELRPAVGLEMRVDPLSFRAGYKSGRALEEFSIGAGFLMGSMSLDYAFGFASTLASNHRVSLSTRFGGAVKPTLVKQPAPPADVDEEIVEAPGTPPTVQAAAAPAAPVEAAPVVATTGLVTYKTNPKPKTPEFKTPGVYVVKSGDTLEKIARRVYGSKNYWTLIFDANEDIITNTKVANLTGQRLWLPKKPAEAQP